MKIAYIIHSLYVGGAETIVVEYLLQLKRNGHDVCLIEFSHSNTFLCEKLKEAGIRIITLNDFRPNLISRIDYKLFGCMRNTKKLNKLIKSERFDIVHIHTSLNGIKYIDFDYNRVFYSFHTSVERNLNSSGKLHRKNMFKFAENGMNFLTLSEEMRNEAQKILPTDKISVLPNGLNFEKIKSKTYTKEDISRQFEIEKDAFLMCHVARMHHIKNHVKTIEVFNEVIKKRPNSYLLLIGQENEDILSQINRLSEKYNLVNRIKILGSREDATALMSACDAMILPSFTEGFSLVALEAQVLGVRCVLTDSVPDIVVCNDNCFKLSINETNEKWADYILGDFVETANNEISNLEIENIVNILQNLYIIALNEERI